MTLGRSTGLLCPKHQLGTQGGAQRAWLSPNTATGVKEQTGVGAAAAPGATKDPQEEGDWKVSPSTVVTQQKSHKELPGRQRG